MAQVRVESLASPEELRDDRLVIDSRDYLWFGLRDPQAHKSWVQVGRILDVSPVVESVIDKGLEKDSRWVAFTRVLPDRAKEILSQLHDVRQPSQSRSGWTEVIAAGSRASELRPMLASWGNSADFLICVVGEMDLELAVRHLQREEVRQVVELASLAVVQSGDSDEGTLIVPSDQSGEWQKSLRDT